ncbi:MAG: NF038122 family metalloprotease [Planctomycetota bacterium]
MSDGFPVADREVRIMLSKLISGSATFLIATATCFAQPAIDQVPVRIEIDGDQYQLVTSSIEPTVASWEILPKHIPVVTSIVDGGTISGQLYTNSSDSRQVPHGQIVLSVSLDDTGKYNINQGQWQLTHGTAAPGQSFVIPGSQFAMIEYVPEPELGVSQPLGPILERPMLTVEIDFENKPDGLTESEITDAVHRAIEVWAELLDPEVFSLSFRVEFDDTFDDTFLAAAPVFFDNRRWNTIYNFVITLYSGEDVDSTEQGVYNWLPSGSSIPFMTEDEPSDFEDDISLTTPMLLAIFGNPSPQLTILIDPTPAGTLRWDASPKDNREVDPGSFDLTGVIIHELGHWFGFTSRVGDIPFPEEIAMLDVFRFAADRGPTISAGEFQGTRRELTVNAPAITGWGLNDPGAVFAMSRGAPIPDEGERQASHWDVPPVGALGSIGIMAPVFSAGVSGSAGGFYLSDADVKAFDLIGYEIDQNDIPDPVVESILGFPGPLASVDPTTDLTFTWSAVPQATN